MSTNLILFTIGPVQRFISTARKAEDLWMGSYILSYLNGYAINDFSRSYPDSILFPSLESHPLIKKLKGESLNTEEAEDIVLPTLPNRFLAIVVDKEIAILKKKMREIQGAVLKEFKEIVEYVFNEAFTNWEGTFAEVLLNRQAENFLEIYWIINPWNKEREEYIKAYSAGERKLGAVKNCRWFNQTEEESRKCSLCGEREVVHFQKFTNEPMSIMNKKIESDWESNWNTANPREKYTRKNEYLCSICLTKRMAEIYFYKNLGISGKGKFPSTAEVATASFKYAMATREKNYEYLSLYENFINAVKNVIKEEGALPDIEPLPKIAKTGFITKSKNIDGFWLYKENWREEFLKKQFRFEVSQTDIEKVLDVRKKLFDSLNADPSKKIYPQKYYSLIVMDGDSMGEKLNKVSTSVEHGEISRRLNMFTHEAKRIVEGKYLGKLLYSGGDDLMALANLEDLFLILEELRHTFTDTLYEDYTLSAGVAIAHVKTPLNEVLKWAAEMEKEAKNNWIGDKNAFGIALLKHSGDISKTIVKWEYNNLTESTINTAKKLSKALGEVVSNKFMYSLRDEFYRLIDKNLKTELVEDELKRLMKRAEFKDKKSEEGVDLQALAKNLANLMINPPFSTIGLNNFLGFLEISNFISKKE